MEIYGLQFNATGDESDATNIGIVRDAPTHVCEVGEQETRLPGWYQLEDDTGIKAYFGDEALAAFVQRVVDPTRWKYLTEEDKAFLRKAIG